jgi:hypothetical protein
MLELQKKSSDDDSAPAHKVTWDLTINVPTLVMLVTTVVTCAGWGIAKYSDVDSRVTANNADGRVFRRDIDRLDLETKALRAEQASKIDALRGEMRGELRDVNGKLDQLLIRSSR